MELKSLISVEIASSNAKTGGDQIAGSLNKIDKAAISAKKSAAELGPQIGSSMANASQSTKQATRNVSEFDNAVISANKNAASFPKSVIAQVVAYGAAFASVTAITAKFVNDNRQFQTGMVGVAKTTNLAGADLDNFKKRIIDISKSVPVSTNELLELAQAAGQMGVRGSANLEQFATTMAKIGRATDLSGADAARGLARILAVSGETTQDLGMLANVIVKMGNNSQATESEIAGMTTEIAQSLSVYKIASAQSVALAAAMKSIGIRAELGGSAVGRSMGVITNSVMGSKKSLDEFSKALNLDPAKLKNLFETNKIQAFNYFLEGIKSKGLGAGLALKNIGLGGEEIAKSIIPLANNLQILESAQKQVNDELKSGTALQNEFAATIDTFDSQIAISGNILKSYGMELTGGVFKSITNGIKDLNEAANSGGLNAVTDAIAALSLVAGGRLVGAFAASTAAGYSNIKMLQSESAAYAENSVRTAAAAETTAVAARNKLALANAELASIEKAILAERAMQAARIDSLRSIVAEMNAERALEESRFQAQISQKGRELSFSRMAQIRLREVAIIKQIESAEVRLAATTVEANAAAQLAIQKRAAAELEAAGASKIAAAASATAAAQVKSIGLAATTAGLAARGLSGAMALLGGPAGVVFLAAGAIAYFATRTTDSEARLSALGDTVDEVVEKFKKMGDAQKQLAELDLSKGLDKAQEDLKNANAAFNVVKGAKPGTFSDEMFKKAAADIESTTQEVEKLQTKLLALRSPDTFEKMRRDAEDLATAFDIDSQTKAWLADTSVMAESTSNVTKETQKLSDEVAKQVALYGNKSKAMEFMYDTEHGLIDITDEKIKNQILNNYKLLDSKDNAKELAQLKMSIDLLDNKSKVTEFVYKQEHGLLDITDKKLQQQMKDLYAIQDLKEKQKADNEMLYKISQDDYKQQQDAYKAQLKQGEDAAKEFARPWQEAAERIDSSFADMWAGSFQSFTAFRKQMQASAAKLVGELIHQFTTKKLTTAFMGLMGGGNAAMDAWSKIPATLDNAFDAAPLQQPAKGGFGGLGGGLSSLTSGINPYVVGGVVLAGAVSLWNKQQDEKFLKMTAEYKQANQNMSKVLGEGNIRSKSLDNGIERLQQYQSSIYGVNKNMLGALLDIRTGIDRVAAGFAKTLTGSGNYSELGIKTGTSTSPIIDTLLGKGGSIIGNLLGDDVGGFLNGVVGKVSSAIYNKKKKVIDTGIEIMGGSLADIMNGAQIGAFNYADVKTTKKILGVTTSSKNKRTKEELDSSVKDQLSDVFADAGEALKQASSAFGIDFEQAKKSLIIKQGDLSLKGLKGDELTAAVNDYFSAQLDGFAETLLAGTDVLQDLQKVGESAFDSMIRLSSETNQLKFFVDTLGLNFKATGVAAVYATQQFADAAGGFDKLQSKLSIFYDKFYSESDKFIATQKQIDAAFKSLGIQVPKTREEFKNLITGLDTTTETGAKTASSLLDLVSVMDGYYTQLGETEVELADTRLKGAKELLEYSKSLLQVADDLLLSDLSPLNGMDQFKQAQQNFRTSSPDDLINNAKTYLEKAREAFASGGEYNAAFEEVQRILRQQAAQTGSGAQPTDFSGKTQSAQAIADSIAISKSVEEKTKADTEAVAAKSAREQAAAYAKEQNALLQKQLEITEASLNEYRRQGLTVSNSSEANSRAIASLERRIQELTDIIELNNRKAA